MQDNKKISFLNKISLKKAIYPVISFIFALVVILLFFYSVKFIVASINKTFYVPTESEVASQIVTFDKANYLLLAKKLGISVLESQPVVAPQAQPEAPIATSTPATIDKKTIKIAIYNSTQTSGLAAKLKTVLVGGGFAVAETGTVSPTLEETTIKIKESLVNSPASEEIKNLVSSKYQIVSQSNTATSTFDVEIIIGKK